MAVTELRHRLCIEHSCWKRCSECGSDLGEDNAVSIDGFDAAWCVVCVASVLHRALRMEERPLLSRQGVAG